MALQICSRDSQSETIRSPAQHNDLIRGGGTGQDSLDFPLVDVSTVADPKDHNIISQNSKNDPIVADAVLTKTCKWPFEDWIDSWFLRQLLLNLVKDPSGLYL